MNFFKENRTFVALLIATILTGGMLRPLPKNIQKRLEDNRFWCEKRYNRKRRYDVLFMGDSRTTEGVSPEVLQKYVANMSFYNFGFSRGRINRQLLTEAKRRLKRNKKRILVFGCTCIDLMNKKK